jgi:hypothetical protein
MDLVRRRFMGITILVCEGNRPVNASVHPVDGPNCPEW